MKFWKTIKNFVRIERIDAGATEFAHNIFVVENCLMHDVINC